MRRLFLHLLLPALLCLIPAAAAAADGFVPVPGLTGHVVDRAGMLDGQQRAALDGVLAEYETRTGSQIAVLLMASTAPEAIEQYSIRVADAWKLGRKGVDDGVILVVARDNPKALRRLRIEAGRGVQGSLTDAQSKRILEDVIAPHFRQNDFYGGLAAGVSAIAALLDKESLPPAQHRAQPQAAQDDGGGWFMLVVVLVFLVGFFAMLMKSRRSARNNLTSNDWGHGAGVIIGSLLEQAARNASSGRSGGFGSSGGFGGGSSGGGSFSGGGGSFDGGGASGDW